MPNRLAEAISPYLRSHADNPVDWWAWGPEAFAEAARRDVPVMVSIGYSTCHWCHVMARESFSDPAIAELLNDGLVAIKVDREEHPDVDASYLAGAAAFTEGLGWPLTVSSRPRAACSTPARTSRRSRWPAARPSARWSTPSSRRGRHADPRSTGPPEPSPTRCAPRRGGTGRLDRAAHPTRDRPRHRRPRAVRGRRVRRLRRRAEVPRRARSAPAARPGGRRRRTARGSRNAR